MTFARLKKRLPPMHSLRGFEAAARHLSFSLAAREMLVTQSAVSHQIRELENFFGAPLFTRMTRRIELTERGRELAEIVSAFLGDIEGLSAVRGGQAGRRELVISALPTIATMWLMPRLHRFTQAQSEIEVRIVSGLEPPDFKSQQIDVAIRVGKLPGRGYPRHAPRVEMAMVDDWAGIHAESLFPDILVPVCSPQFQATHRLAAIEDLTRMPLIHTSTRRFAWTDWLKAHRLKAERSAHSLSYGHFFMSLDAARQGLGIALVPSILLPRREDGGLVDPIGLHSVERAPVPSAGEYYLLTHESRLNDPVIQAFRTWLLSEAQIAAERLRTQL